MPIIQREDLTVDVLKEFIEYCPITGKFTYIKKTGKKSVIGAEIGSISKRDGHLEIRFMGTLYRANRLAWFYMTGEWPTYVDHIDHNELNNAWNNLRNVTKAENNKNMPRRINNTSGHTGIWWHKKNKCWIAEIMSEGIKIHLGSFANLEDAIARRKVAENDLGFHPNHGKPKQTSTTIPSGSTL